MLTNKLRQCKATQSGGIGGPSRRSTFLLRRQSKAGEIKRYFRPTDWEFIESIQLPNAGSRSTWGEDVSDTLPATLPACLQILADLNNDNKHLWTPPVWFVAGNPRSQLRKLGGYLVSGSVAPGGLLEVGQLGYRVVFSVLPPPSRPPEKDIAQFERHLPQASLTFAKSVWAFEGWPVVIISRTYVKS